MSTIMGHDLSFMQGCNRRRFIKTLMMSFMGGLVLRPVDALGAMRPVKRRRIKLYNPYTAEHFDSDYWREGKYLPNALEQINYIMRDIHTEEIRAIDPGLLDVLHAITLQVKRRGALHIVSGYRSARTNTLLRKRGLGAAKRSYHLKGAAADIQLPGYNPAELRSIAAGLKAGGVGYYPRMRFVHVDVGPVRSWTGRKSRK